MLEERVLPQLVALEVVLDPLELSPAHPEPPRAAEVAQPPTHHGPAAPSTPSPHPSRRVVVEDDQVDVRARGLEVRPGVGQSVRCPGSQVSPRVILQDRRRQLRGVQVERLKNPSSRPAPGFGNRVRGDWTAGSQEPGTLSGRHGWAGSRIRSRGLSRYLPWQCRQRTEPAVVRRSIGFRFSLL